MNQQNQYYQHRTLTLMGLVQGVGYRPFVRREALSRKITGSVRNIGGGVTVCAFGNKEALDSFVECLLSSPPNGTIYLHTQVSEAKEIPQDQCPDCFLIEESDRGDLLSIIAPDIAPCMDCEKELFDPASRRYRYPFQSCALCGPRYSIQQTLPYDRGATVMGGFSLCKECQAEYQTPLGRRSYAQTIACKECGPRLTFHPADPKAAPIHGDEAALDAALSLLCTDGAKGVLAVKNNGGFHLACRADNREAILAIRELKDREEKPFALLFADLAAIEAVAHVSHSEAELLTSPARPIVLLEPNGSPFLPEVSGESCLMGAMLPSTPLQRLLAEAGTLVMTSANPSGEPIYTHSTPLREWLGSRGAILDHDRLIVTPQDDSLLFVENGKPCFLRRGRGYAPLPIRIEGRAEPSIAFGSDLKAVFALAKDEYVYLSQHTGDLADQPICTVWKGLQTHLSALLGIVPRRGACDLHPGYISSQIAQESGLPLTYIQHHHAHIASVMAEHTLHRVLGFAFDGTGYGTDGTIWGGELLLCQGKEFRRLEHLLPLPMPMGDEGAKDTHRLSRFFLAGAGAEPTSSQDGLIHAAVRAGLGIPTSSMGRLFDAVSALLGLCTENRYESRAAILLENAATIWEAQGFAPENLTLSAEGEVWRSDRLLCTLQQKVQEGTPVGALALGFHHAIADRVRASAISAAMEYGCREIALSGGVFANRLLLRLCREGLARAGLTVYRNEKVPVGDGGIALGQAYLQSMGESH